MNGLLAVVVLATGVSAGGMPVYKCEEKGVITYTDRPCSAQSEPIELPAPILTVAPTANERALAQAWDRFAVCYATQLIGVTRLIHGGTQKSAQLFADAFKLRREP